MAGLVPAIHALLSHRKKDVDARHKAGHDGNQLRSPGRQPRGQPALIPFKHGLSLSPRNAPELLQNFRPERAWGIPGAQCTRGLVCAYWS
jgi:hypothetical protein